MRSTTKEPDRTSYDAGRFIARIVHVTTADTRYGNANNHAVTVTMSMKNVTDQPMTLAYRALSQQLADDRGHTFVNELQVGDVAGIGLNTGRAIDGQFTLAPGEVREASFKNLVRLVNGDQPGSRYDYDLVLDECERLPNQQVRVLRTYSVAFHDF